MDIDLGELRRRDAYALMTSFIVPRAIGWVSTMDKSGHVNLAPFSYFTGLGSDPPMCMLGIANRRDGSEKDTLRIARATGVLCVNLVEEPVAEQMVHTSGDFPPEVSELSEAGLTSAPCKSIAGVRVAACRAALECRLVDVHTYGREAKTNIVVAEAIHAWVDDALVTGGAATPTLDPSLVRPVARLGGKHYARLGERFELSRPKV